MPPAVQHPMKPKYSSFNARSTFVGVKKIHLLGYAAAPLKKCLHSMWILAETGCRQTRKGGLLAEGAQPLCYFPRGPLSSSTAFAERSKSRASRISVLNNTSGGTPGGTMRSRTAWVSGR